MFMASRRMIEGQRRMTITRRIDRGVSMSMNYMKETVHYTVTCVPESFRHFVWLLTRFLRPLFTVPTA